MVKINKCTKITKQDFFAESRQQYVPYVLQGSPCKIAHPSILGEELLLKA